MSREPAPRAPEDSCASASAATVAIFTESPQIVRVISAAGF
jgi:hypothetical protein